jgi:hypothetical protein
VSAARAWFELTVRYEESEAEAGSGSESEEEAESEEAEGDAAEEETGEWPRGEMPTDRQTGPRRPSRQPSRQPRSARPRATARTARTARTLRRSTAQPTGAQGQRQMARPRATAAATTTTTTAKQSLRPQRQPRPSRAPSCRATTRLMLRSTRRLRLTRESSSGRRMDAGVSPSRSVLDVCRKLARARRSRARMRIICRRGLWIALVIGIEMSSLNCLPERPTVRHDYMT